MLSTPSVVPQVVAQSLVQTILHIRATIAGLPLAAAPSIPAGPALAPTATATPTTVLLLFLAL